MRRKRKITNKEIELALAWLEDDMKLFEVGAELKPSVRSRNALYYIANFLKEAYRMGKLKVAKPTKK